MNQNISDKVDSKIKEDLSPTRNLTGLHLKIVASIAIIWSLFQLWYASPFPFWFNIGMFKGLPARAIHLGFALTLAFLIYPTFKGKKISIIGDISYSIYLIHYPIILTILFILNFLELKINFNTPFIFLMYLVITFLISFCSYKFIEIPLKIIFRNKYLKK